jgi:peptidoglycan hydrolase-like protein with peptidoglycan-binding domain
LTPRIGSQTRAAISVFQQAENLPESGKLDSDTRARLTLDSPILTSYVVTTNDLARLQPLGKTWLEKSQQSALDYETELELVGKKAHSHPLLIQKLNPTWTGRTFRREPF